MDKYEYKIKADEIKALIAQGEYQQAAEIADSIDWRRVKSVMMLCTISDLYKINRRYEDSRDILLLAYDRHPGGRTIVYSLCELSIKIEDYVMAIEYYKEFVQIAPKDTGRYILQYKLYQAQDVSLEERIAVLEELKSKEYREKWAYELAYLYHRVGLATKCVEECDELILWFGEGKYVVKAMELKMLHQSLTPQQQEKYDSRFQTEQTGGYQEQGAEEQGIQGDDQNNAVWTETQPERSAAEEAAEAVQPADVLSAPTIRIPSEEIDIQVKTMDVGQYNTINLQKELAEGLREVLEEKQPRSEVETEVFFGATGEIGDGMQEETFREQPEENLEFVSEELLGDEGLAVEELPAEAETELLPGEEPYAETETEPLAEAEAELPIEEEFSAEAEAELRTEELPEGAEAELQTEEMPTEAEAEPAEKVIQEAEPEDHTAAVVMEQLRIQNLGIEPPKEMASVLSMESDGQISLVVPESEKVEKQITGQMSIQDILAEWERIKKENEEKRKENLHQRVLQQTGPLFTAFEESIRDGLLEQLEQGAEPEDIGITAEAASETEQTADSEELIGAEDEVEELAEIEELTVEEPEDDFDEISEEEYTEEEAEDFAEEIATDEIAEEVSEEDAEEAAAGEDVEEAFRDEIIDDASEEEASGEEAIDDASEEEASGEEALEEVSGEEESFEKAAEEEIEEEVRKAAVEEEPAEEQLTEENTEESPAEKEEPEEEPQAVSREKAQVRALTKEEKELYGTFIQSKSSKEKLIAAIDSISMASYTGNVVITGDEGMDTLSLAKNMVREVQITDSNFSGKIAKISGSSLNQRDVAKTLDGLANGALIIQKASEMNKNTVDTLYKKLQQEQYGLIVIMEDTRKAMNKFLGVYTKLAECFNARVDMEALSNDALVAFGKKYAKEMEYSIDELGVLALHTRITEMQTSDHAVTIMDVKEIMDEAIQHANRKTMGHFMDILLAKRYDEEDMIILRENDFI